MSARHLLSLKTSDNAGTKVFSTALFIALAMNQSHQDPFLSRDLGISSGSGVAHYSQEVSVSFDAGPNAGNKLQRISNSVDLLYGIEDGQETLAFVPLIVHPDSVTDEVKMDKLQSIMAAMKAGLSYRHLQQCVDQSFPENNFSQHLSTHLRTLLKNEAFFEVPLRSQDVPYNGIFSRLGQTTSRWITNILGPQSTMPAQTPESYGEEKTIALKQVKIMQKWFAHHLRPIGQMAHISMSIGEQMRGFDREGYPLVNTEIYPYDRFSRDEIEELYQLSNHFNHVRDDFIQKARALKAKLSPKIRSQWRAHAKRAGIAKNKDFRGADKLMNAVIWMLAYAPPEFFVNHRSDFAELADLYTKDIGEIEGPTSKVLEDLSFMGRAMKDMCLKAEDMVPLKRSCVALMSHAYWETPNAPLHTKGSPSSK
eukprot:Blabericola_migrator_1__6156@NODE_3104_length_2033_cov_47_788403_g1943_i0_p1_GENE_NODE_3104_length_2033_cov_47_788403_g1943_i0NODE_3104_length_2033_cov_47_788403_g1943_i0_p1_ORF_typecomplete_len424_score59_00GlutR_dimer/PF00745_20/17GlutR_dimer/PF00745_20/40_NODE_3104_length_2033_cov_47_788403_g1943_i06661937